MLHDAVEVEVTGGGPAGDEPTKFDPYALCEAHGIRVYDLSDLREFADDVAAVAHFTVERASHWSAALTPLGSARVVIEIDNHAPVRRRSSIAHELGHQLLEHAFDRVVLGEDHTRQFNGSRRRRRRSSRENR